MRDPINLHETTDCLFWEEAFMATFPNCGIPEGTMIAWFANAMMAKADEITRADLPRPQDVARIAELEAALERIAAMDRRSNYRCGDLSRPMHVDGPIGKIARAALAADSGAAE